MVYPLQTNNTHPGLRESPVQQRSTRPDISVSESVAPPLHLFSSRLPCEPQTVYGSITSRTHFRKYHSSKPLRNNVEAGTAVNEKKTKTKKHIPTQRTQCIQGRRHTWPRFTAVLMKGPRAVRCRIKQFFIRPTRSNRKHL